MTREQRAASSRAYRWASARLEVKRLAVRYGWEDSVEKDLQELGAPPLKYLGPGYLEQLELVLVRLRDQETCLSNSSQVREPRAQYAA